MSKDLENRIRQALQRAAESKQVISYRMLAIEAEVPGPQVIHKLTHCLEEILRSDHTAGRLSLVPLAVSRGEPAIPRSGFFILLRELGLYEGTDQGSDAIIRHQQMVKEIFNQAST